jgi:hypothetical protein
MEATKTETKKSWRDVIEIHPAANVFPLLAEEDLKALAKDIEQNGLRSRVACWRDDEADKVYLIDGRSRLDALELLGRTVLDGTVIDRQYSTGVCATGEPSSLVIGYNIRRRHLSKEQQADLIVKVMNASTDFANLAKSVKRDDSGKLIGSEKSQNKQKAIEEGLKQGISKRTVERSLAKAKGPTKSPREKKPPEPDYKVTVEESEDQRVEPKAQTVAVKPASEAAPSFAPTEVEAPRPIGQWTVQSAINETDIFIRVLMDRAPDRKGRYAFAVEIQRLGIRFEEENRKGK